MYEALHALSNEGFVAASIQYRLSPPGQGGPTGIWPAHIQDAKCAVRWLRNQQLVSIDKKRIGAAGWSAGAHLALMLGVTDQSADATASQLIQQYRQTIQYTDTDDRVQAVASFAGVTDLLSTWQNLDRLHSLNEDNNIDFRIDEAIKYALIGIKSLFPNNPPDNSSENRALFTQNSPLFFVDEDSAVRVPFLMVHGEEDIMVPFSEGCKFADKVNGLGGNATVLHYTGAGSSHFSFFKFRPKHVAELAPGYGSQSVNTSKDLVSFFKAHLQANPVAPRYSVSPSDCNGLQ
jgi:acetyl esterase/lipase